MLFRLLVDLCRVLDLLLVRGDLFEEQNHHQVSSFSRFRSVKSSALTLRAPAGVLLLSAKSSSQETTSNGSYSALAPPERRFNLSLSPSSSLSFLLPLNPSRRLASGVAYAKWKQLVEIDTRNHSSSGSAQGTSASLAIAELAPTQARTAPNSAVGGRVPQQLCRRCDRGLPSNSFVSSFSPPRGQPQRSPAHPLLLPNAEAFAGHLRVRFTLAVHLRRLLELLP